LVRKWLKRGNVGTLFFHFMDKIIEKKGRFTKKQIWYGVIGLVVLALILKIAFGDKSRRLNVDLDKVTVEEVKQDLFKDYIAVIGTVAPIQTIYLDATESGSRVEEIVRREGSMVKKGDVIARFSNTSLVIDISRTESDASRTTNELRNARLSMQKQLVESQSQLLDQNYKLQQQERAYQRSIELHKKNLISDEEYKRSKEDLDYTMAKIKLLKESIRQDSIYRGTQVVTLENDVTRMQQNLAIVRQRFEGLNLRAPVAGELASLDLEVGQVVSMGTRIGQINVLDSYKLKVEIDEHYISRVTRNLIGACDFSGTSYKAKITKVYPEVRNGRFTVDMEFVDSIPSDIRIGQTSRIRLELGESNMAILIPRGGFYQSTGGQWIFVVDPSGTVATKRPIRINRQNPLYYEVVEGLKPGEKVIVSSYDTFGDVDKLILKK